MSPHTELARWAELVIVAPHRCPLGRVANGISEDLVSATIIATTAPVLLAPAMHTEMWEHPATERNLETLRGFGYHVVGPEVGSLAGGDVGTGRVAEPEEIVAAAGDLLGGDGDDRKGPGDRRWHPRAGRPGALPGQPLVGEWATPSQRRRCDVGTT